MLHHHPGERFSFGGSVLDAGCRAGDHIHIIRVELRVLKNVGFNRGSDFGLFCDMCGNFVVWRLRHLDLYASQIWEGYRYVELHIFDTNWLAELMSSRGFR